MIFTGITIDSKGFNSQSNPNSIDKYNILSDLFFLKDHYIPNIVDIGPYEEFDNFDLLHSIIKRLHYSGFQTRILTSGINLNEYEKVLQQFKDLSIIGNKYFILRLDDEKIKLVSDNNIINYTKALKALAISSNIRFEMENGIPERLLDILKQIESLIFNNDIYFTKKIIYNNQGLNYKKFLTKFSKEYIRLRIDENNELFVKTKISNEYAEFHVGDLKVINFRDLIKNFQVLVEVENNITL